MSSTALQLPRRPIIWMKFVSFLVVLELAAASPLFAIGGDGDSRMRFKCERLYELVVRPLENLIAGRIGTPPSPSNLSSWFNGHVADLEPAAGSVFEINAAELPFVSDHLDWMIGALRARTITRPDRSIDTLRAIRKLTTYRRQTVQRGDPFEWGTHLDLTAEFAYAMGHKRIPNRISVFNNNIALSRDLVNDFLTEIKAAGPYALFFSTPADMDIRYFNDLSPYPIFPLQTVKRRIEDDGQLYYEFSFWAHDINHSIGKYETEFESLIKEIQLGSKGKLAEYRAKIIRNERFYQAFRRFVGSEPSNHFQIVYEEAWFFQHFEGLGHGDIRSFVMDPAAFNRNLQVPGFRGSKTVFGGKIKEKTGLSQETVDAALVKLATFANEYAETSKF